jgi:hypothetical protein
MAHAHCSEWHLRNYLGEPVSNGKSCCIHMGPGRWTLARGEDRGNVC